MSPDVDLTGFFVFTAALILLAVTSIHFGVDSREGFTADGRNTTRRGII